MRKNPNTDNGGARIGTTSEEDLTAAQLLELFQTAYPINWAQLLPDRLHTLGVTDLASLSPSKLTDFKDAVFRSARHAGIRDPAVWISHRAGRIETKAPLLNPPCGPGEHHASRKIPLASNAIVPRNSPASAAPSTPLSVQRTTSYGTTKAEVLCRTKAAIEGRKSRFYCRQAWVRAGSFPRKPTGNRSRNWSVGQLGQSLAEMAAIWMQARQSFRTHDQGGSRCKSKERQQRG